MSDPMDHVSKPLLGVLVAVVAFAGLWMVALKPHASSGGSSGGSSPAPASAPAPAAAPAAKPAVHPVPRALAPRRVHRPVPAARPHPVRAAHVVSRPRSVPASQARPTATGRLNAVQRALLGGKVLALLFYNPGAADDQAVRQELAGIPGHAGRVFSLAIPLSELSAYSQITSQVPVNFSPTLVIVDRSHQAQEIIGFADSFEIAQRIQDALSARPATR